MLSTQSGKKPKFKYCKIELTEQNNTWTKLTTIQELFTKFVFHISTCIAYCKEKSAMIYASF